MNTSHKHISDRGFVDKPVSLNMVWHTCENCIEPTGYRASGNGIRTRRCLFDAEQQKRSSAFVLAIQPWSFAVDQACMYSGSVTGSPLCRYANRNSEVAGIILSKIPSYCEMIVCVMVPLSVGSTDGVTIRHSQPKNEGSSRSFVWRIDRTWIRIALLCLELTTVTSSICACDWNPMVYQRLPTPSSRLF